MHCPVLVEIKSSSPGIQLLLEHLTKQSCCILVTGDQIRDTAIFHHTIIIILNCVVMLHMVPTWFVASDGALSLSEVGGELMASGWKKQDNAQHWRLKWHNGWWPAVSMTTRLQKNHTRCTRVRLFKWPTKWRHQLFCIWVVILKLPKSNMKAIICFFFATQHILLSIIVNQIQLIWYSIISRAPSKLVLLYFCNRGPDSRQNSFWPCNCYTLNLFNNVSYSTYLVRSHVYAALISFLSTFLVCQLLNVLFCEFNHV